MVSVLLSILLEAFYFDVKLLELLRKNVHFQLLTLFHRTVFFILFIYTDIYSSNRYLSDLPLNTSKTIVQR